MSKNRSFDAFDDAEEISISRVGPWRNKDELRMVYDWLFADTHTNYTRQKAFERLKIWKLRRLTLTPASILSTLSMLEVQLKDASEKYCDVDLQKMYSDAFTRFVNYMSSIMRSRTISTMYSTARELGMESFLIDLRHLCAHGQVLPSLAILRRTANYCMTWLKEFYWDRELDVITDADATDVRLKLLAESEEMIRECFTNYDQSTDAMLRGLKMVEEFIDAEEQQPNDKNIDGVKLFVEENPHTKLKLKFLADKMVNRLGELSTSDESVHSKAIIFCDALLSCRHFIESSAAHFDDKSKDKRQKFVAIHQNIFRLFAICDFINQLFLRLVSICEDDAELMVQRKAASFWANEIAQGFLLLKEFKNFYKSKREKRSNFELDFTSINNDVMTDDVKEIYRKLNADTKGTLIFGDSLRRPWSLYFERSYLMERAQQLNEYSIDLVEKCIYLAEPPLNQTQIEFVKKTISIYSGRSVNVAVSSDDNGHVFTIPDRSDTPQTTNEMENSIWRKAPDHLDWKCCPLGVLP